MIRRAKSLFGWRLIAMTLGIVLLTAMVVQAQFPPFRPATVRGVPDMQLAAGSTAVKNLAGVPVFILTPPNPNFPKSSGPSPLRPGTPVPTLTNPPLGLVGQTGNTGNNGTTGNTGNTGNNGQTGNTGVSGNFQGASGANGGVGGFSGGQGFGGGISGFQIVPGVFVLPTLPVGFVGSMSGGVGFNGGFQGQFQGAGGLQGFQGAAGFGGVQGQQGVGGLQGIQGFQGIGGKFGGLNGYTGN